MGGRLKQLPCCRTGGVYYVHISTLFGIQSHDTTTIPTHRYNRPRQPPPPIQCRRAICNDMPIPDMGLDSQSRDAAAASPQGAKHELQAGPFVLRTLLENVPLSEDGDHDKIKINCVDYLGEEPPS